MSVLLDTHVWIWWLTPESRLTARERLALDRAAETRELHIAAISLWEAQVLHARKRIELPVPFAEWIAHAADPRMLTVLPLDVDVIVAADALPAGFHGDPADRLIVATARAHALALATHDTEIRRSRVVTLWKA
ncbi:MAG TPA: type II toxin-antitoxin system VapC family toxin [Burkholderiales bacterium]|nr:type II toxin-antitoxin system VapC family toxin [Burkholderiales bacterium]